MPSTAPETRVRIATIRNGNSAQVGNRVASAPIGSAATAALSLSSDPASSSPKNTRTMGATDPPIVFQATICPSGLIAPRILCAYIGR